MEQARQTADAPDRAPAELSRGKALLLTAAAASAIVAIGALDASTGYEFGLSPLYLIPIMATAYLAGRWAGLFSACLSAAAWYFADAFARHPYEHPLALYWNTGVRLLIFVLISLLLTRLRANLAIETAQRVRLAQLNELKSEFVGIAAHDLRTPLAVVQMYAHLALEKRGDVPEERRAACLRVITDRADFMLRMVENLLDLATIESGSLKLAVRRHDYLAFLGEKMVTLGALAEQREVRLVLAGGGIPPLPFDRERIEQVIDNLVINALKFSPPGSAITISVARERDRVVTRVTDEGRGIPADDLPQIFTPFRTSGAKTYRGEKGAGLGLTIVKKIVEAHRGEVGVTSEPGKGSTFFFALPLDV